MFYNGSDDKPDQVLQLTDAFPDDLKMESGVEIRVRMININYGNNWELLEKSRPLGEYAWFIDTVQRNMKGMDNEAAIDSAIDAMPRNCES